MESENLGGPMVRGMSLIGKVKCRGVYCFVQLDLPRDREGGKVGHRPAAGVKASPGFQRQAEELQ